MLEELLPEFAHLSDTIRVIDVPRETGGLILRVLMNADLDQAVAFLARSPEGTRRSRPKRRSEASERTGEEHWRWRFRMAQRIAAQLDPEQFGVKAFYLIGSTKNATAGRGKRYRSAGPLRGHGGAAERVDAVAGRLEPLPGGDELPAHRHIAVRACSTCTLITDKDIAERSSYAVKIDAVTDPARKLPMKGA